MNAKTCLPCFVTLLMGTISFAEEIEPGAIFKQVVAAYESMDTYSAEGKIVADIDSGISKVKMETTFSIRLKRPDRYLIVWDQKNVKVPGFTQAGAVWNDGSQPYLYMGVAKAYSKMNSDEMALGAATGISGGAAYTIPAIFLSTFEGAGSPFSRFADPKLESDEQVEGEDCYVIGGSSAASKKETFWISKKNHLIRKYSRSFEPPEGGRKTFKLTDEQLESAIKGSGQEVTAETKEAMRKVLQQAEETLKTAKLKGTSTEVHTKIEAPALVDKDFAFQVPAGTVLRDSLLGDGLKRKSSNVEPPR